MRHGRPALFVALLLALFVMSGLLASEAWQAARTRKALAEQTMRDIAMFAGSKYRDNVQAWLYSALDEVFVTARLEMSKQPVSPASAVASMEQSAKAYDSCKCAPTVRAMYFFAIPLDTLRHPAPGMITGGAVEASASERAWLADTVAGNIRHLEAQRVLLDWWGPIASAHRFATVYSRFDHRPTVAVYTAIADAKGRPALVYGLVTDRERFAGPFLAPLFAHRPLLPPLRTKWAPNDSMLSVIVADSLGQLFFRSPVQYTSPLYSHIALDPPLGGLRVDVTMRPALEGVLVGGIPQSRLPLLIGILLATAALTVAVLRQLRAELELARQRANFAASVSHELRTPLAQILLFAETIRLGRATSEQRRTNAVDVIIREARRLMTLVENVLHVSRSERGLTRVTLEWIVMQHVVTETVDEFAPLAGEAASAIVLAQLDVSVLANADAGAVRQMLLNVLDNAVKYGRKGQQIHVAVTYAAGTVQLSVDDEGPGVRNADRERIWKPFVRLDRQGARVEGAGIGLAVVRELVGAQRGRVWVERGSRGGARFVIALPGALADDDSDASMAAGAAAGDD